MKKRYKFATLIVALLTLTIVATACPRDADVASRNLSAKADNFEVQRRIVFYNGITGEYMLELQGLCSLGNEDDAGELTVTCKTGPSDYKKHFLGLSDNVTYFVEQVDGVDVSTYFYQVTFKPSVIIPAVENGSN